jgi:putative membrane protein
VTTPADLDVDARFLLANERTLLAWVRTSLTLLAAGVGTLQLIEDQWRTGPGLALLLLGAAAAFVGLVRYRRADSAIRRGSCRPRAAGPTTVAAAVGLAAVALTALSLASELF